MDQSERRDSHLLARLANRAAVLAAKAPIYYPFTTATAYAGGVPPATAHPWYPANANEFTAVDPFTTATAYAGGVPTATMHPIYSAYASDSPALDLWTTAIADAGGIPTITIGPTAGTFVSQALSAYKTSAQALAGKPPSIFEPWEYALGDAGSMSLLQDLQLSVHVLTVALTEMKEAHQAPLGGVELEHAAAAQRDFYAWIGRNSQQIVVILAALTLLFMILSWLYPRSTDNTTIQIEHMIQLGVHTCYDHLNHR